MNILYFCKELAVTIFYKYFPLFFPAQKSTITDCGVSMLLCHKDVTMAVYCLDSLFSQLGYALPVYIVDDGSLTIHDYEQLKKLFSVTFENKRQAISKMNKKCVRYPMFIKYLNDSTTHIKKMKFAALFLAPFEKTLCIEPDILFVKPPQEINEFIKNTRSTNYYGTLRSSILNYFVRINFSEVIFRKFIYSQLKITTDFLFNGGLMLVNMQRLNHKAFKRMEISLKTSYELGYHQFFYFEEFLLATLFDSKKDSVLPNTTYFNVAEYHEYNEWKATGKESDIIMFHFTTHARKVLFSKSVQFALRTHFFTDQHRKL